MGELEGVADRLVIIKHGRLVVDTTVAELLHRSNTGTVSVRTRQAAEAMAVLANGGARVTSGGATRSKSTASLPSRSPACWPAPGWDSTD